MAPFSSSVRTRLRSLWVALPLLGATTLSAFAAPPLPVKDSEASAPDQMKRYSELVEHTEEKIEMIPIPGGKYVMGSPDGEKGRGDDEGPQHEVEISPFWMAKCEISWDVYEVWMADIDIARRKLVGTPANERDAAADPFQITKPTKPYTDMSFGMGKRGFPAISMTQHSARTFCQWLSAKTGRYYRLPTEAEWEYACRAGTKTAYSFGDNPEDLDQYAWYYDNSDEKYHKVGTKKPNPWGLHDMHGNVAEWVLDVHSTDFYGAMAGKTTVNPLNVPLTEYNRVARGGAWTDPPEALRSARRQASHEDWKQQDPQIPQSIWYLTDAQFLGFRIVRPLVEPSAEEKAAKWDKSEPPQIDKFKPE